MGHDGAPVSPVWGRYMRTWRLQGVAACSGAARADGHGVADPSYSPATIFAGPAVVEVQPG